MFSVTRNNKSNVPAMMAIIFRSHILILKKNHASVIERFQPFLDRNVKT